MLHRLIAAIGAALIVGCAALPASPTPAHAPLPDATTVTVRRTCATTLHADVQLSDEARAVIDHAGAAWRGPTQGRLNVGVVYDLDFSSPINLQAHEAAKDSLLIPIGSDSEIAARLDAEFAPGRPLAVTIKTDDDRTIVYLIMDRIDEVHALDVVTHEFGHVCGLPDLPMTGAVMSGVSIKGAPPPDGFQPEDMALLRAAHYLD